MRDAAARFRHVIGLIDAVNATDPNIVEVDGQSLPGEHVYGRRMSETLNRMHPDAPECLRIAARGQHIERWKVPRKGYPPGRSGYLEWRKHQRSFQARRLGELMAEAGYAADDVERVGALIRKERLKQDPVAQMLEDVICVMFFEHYLTGFVTRVDEEKLAGILAKTWNRMSEHGHEAVLQLNLPAGVPALLEYGLNRQKASA